MKLTRVFTFSAILLLFFGTIAASFGVIKVGAQNTISVQLTNFGNGVSTLSNEFTHSSAYAVKLVIPYNAQLGSGCMALYPYNKSLNSLQSFQIYASYNNATPRFVISLDTDGNSLADLVLLSDYQFLSNGAWQLSQGGQRWGWTKATPALSEYGDYWDTLSYWKGIYGNATALSVGIAAEYWAVKDAGGSSQPLYADEVVINGVTYNIAGPTQPIVTVKDDWPMYRHDLQRSGVSTTPVTDGNLVWRFFTGPSALASLSDRLRATPTIADGIVYIGSNNTSFYALNATTGTVIWQTGVPSNIESSAAVAYGMVFVGILWDGHNGYVSAYNASNGDKIWTYATNAGVESSPAVVDGVVYIGSYTNVYALNAYTGALKWSYNVGGPTFSSPAIFNGVVYIGSQNGKVCALNQETGVLIWAYQADSAVFASPAVVEDVVYVCSDAGSVYALNINDGAKIWQAYCGSGTDHTDNSPAVANGMVYINARNGVYAFNATNGGQIWFFVSPYSNRPLTGFMYSSPAVVGSTVYVGTVDSYVFALNAYTGKIVWAYQTGGFLFSSPAIANGVLYIGSYDGYVYALGHVSGQLPTPVTPTPTPTAPPAPTASPQPTATPNATTPDPTPAPTQEPLQTSNLNPEPTTNPEPLSQIKTAPNNVATNPATNYQIDWTLLAVIIGTCLTTIASLFYIFRPQ
jgi:outer membrane protein assembly factor BamB